MLQRLFPSVVGLDRTASAYMIRRKFFRRMEVTSMIRLRRLRCSFCRKNNDEVLKLVAGPRVYICDECVAIASRLMEDDSHHDSQTNRGQQTIWRRLVDRVRQALGLSEARRVSV